MLQRAGVCTGGFIVEVDLLESRTPTKLDEQLDSKMWTIETMGKRQCHSERESSQETLVELFGTTNSSILQTAR